MRHVLWQFHRPPPPPPPPPPTSSLEGIMHAFTIFTILTIVTAALGACIVLIVSTVLARTHHASHKRRRDQESRAAAALDSSSWPKIGGPPSGDPSVCERRSFCGTWMIFAQEGHADFLQVPRGGASNQHGGASNQNEHLNSTSIPPRGPSWIVWMF